MTTNFSIHADTIGILFKGRYFDVHNNFVFVDVKHDQTKRKAEINFKKAAGDWIDKNEINGFNIYFDNVKSIYHKDYDKDYPIDYIEQDKNTIDMMGFCYDGDEIMDGFVDVNSSPDLSSLIFVFVTDKAIKITAETAKLVLI